ncbi:hypothetical protein ACG2K1_00975 [Neisseria sp. 23W00296]|uniref:hypothetical protein n=1 Tax=unclassified Neisseria TaxID=2623750 RepID=UPI00375704DE
MKIYIAHTPLILEDADGREYRVEAGEAVDLTPELYELVAAHVSEAEISAADLASSGYQADGETPLTQPETPSENPPDGQPETDKQPETPAAEAQAPKRGSKGAKE